MLKQKLYAIILLLCTLPCIVIEHDMTATILVAMLAIPLLFSRKNWIN